MSEIGSERVLVFAPRGRDADLTCQMLAGHGIDPERCMCGEELIAAIRAGAGCAIVTSEGLALEVRAALVALLAEQPPWSDFPIIVLAGGLRHEDGLDLGNMTMLERPIAPATLVAAVRASLRGRRRQYDARAAIHQRDQFLAMLGHELRNPL
nr:hybrid sensor histidine kinase/response regulator [Deltaproteobacteria bacterium]